MTQTTDADKIEWPTQPPRQEDRDEVLYRMWLAGRQMVEKIEDLEERVAALEEAAP